MSSDTTPIASRKNLTNCTTIGRSELTKTTVFLFFEPSAQYNMQPAWCSRSSR
jgi:hypothetical protein